MSHGPCGRDDAPCIVDLQATIKVTGSASASESIIRRPSLVFMFMMLPNLKLLRLVLLRDRKSATREWLQNTMPGHASREKQNLECGGVQPKAGQYSVNSEPTSMIIAQLRDKTLCDVVRRSLTHSQERQQRSPPGPELDPDS